MEKLPYERIRNLRIDADLSQKQIAEYLHISQNTYSQYEIGTLRFPLEAIVRLAELFHTSIDYLVGLTDEKKPYPRKKSY
ncbi:MAG: helix-turn-helix domain-containing protein [Candidatus Merdivicinus sp.]|jgi:transcriptional regulator with XRE-family HTH domain